MKMFKRFLLRKVINNFFSEENNRQRNYNRFISMQFRLDPLRTVLINNPFEKPTVIPKELLENFSLLTIKEQGTITLLQLRENSNKWNNGK